MRLAPPTADKRYIMIGAPVTSVRTPPLLKTFLASLGVSAEIEVCHLQPEDLPCFMQDVTNDRTVDGLLVTMPHKRAIMPFVQKHAASARQASSANAVKRLGSGSLTCAQFDGVGLVNAVLAKGVALAKARVLLAGVGGAGLAIAHAVAAHGCARLDLIEPNRALLDQALRALNAEHNVPVSDKLQPQAAYELLINATPLGMNPKHELPFKRDVIAEAGAVADIVADPNETQLANLARSEGRLLITGREMVQGQVQPIGQWLLTDDDG
jgi:shikimate dehydrogenase